MTHQLSLPKTPQELEEENKKLKDALRKLYEWTIQVTEELNHFSDRVSRFTFGEYMGENSPDIPSQIEGFRQLICDHTEWTKSRMYHSGEVCKNCGILRSKS